jgi:esterase/lipase superfamily enzyme
MRKNSFFDDHDLQVVTRAARGSAYTAEHVIERALDQGVAGVCNLRRAIGAAQELGDYAALSFLVRDAKRAQAM